MTMLQMECFLEAAKYLSFSMAAANLYLSQSTLSRQIHGLEDELNVALFLRANNTVTLTEAGKKLLPELKALYESNAKALGRLHDIAAGYNGRLYLGIQAGQQICPNLQEALTVLRQKCGSSSAIMLRHLEISQSYTALMDGSIDALLCSSETMPPSDKLAAQVLLETEMYLAVSASHPHSGFAQVEAGQIAAYFGDLPYWVLGLGRGEMIQQPALDDVLKDTAASVLNGSFGDMDSLLMMTEAGIAVTCVNGNSILRANPKVRLIPILSKLTGTPQLVSISLFWREDNGNPLLRRLCTLTQTPELRQDCPLE